MHEYNPRELVAYWRCQKWNNGQIQNGGRWYGTAIVIGQVGRNLILAHRRQLRCSPEHVRLATTEERQLVQTPKAELLGIKDLIEGGAFNSQQFVDCVRTHPGPALLKCRTLVFPHSCCLRNP